MKSYTDLEQSKKLAEFLPIESADMRFCFSHTLGGRITGHYPMIGRKPSMGTVPCWSLSALLDVLPKNLDIGRPILATNYRGYYWVSYFDEYMKEKFTSKIYNNPIDACYEMIVKLHEQKLL